MELVDFQESAVWITKFIDMNQKLLENEISSSLKDTESIEG